MKMDTRADIFFKVRRGSGRWLGVPYARAGYIRRPVIMPYKTYYTLPKGFSFLIRNFNRKVTIVAEQRSHQLLTALLETNPFFLYKLTVASLVNLKILTSASLFF